MEGNDSDDYDMNPSQQQQLLDNAMSNTTSYTVYKSFMSAQEGTNLTPSDQWKDMNSVNASMFTTTMNNDNPSTIPFNPEIPNFNSMYVKQIPSAQFIQESNFNYAQHRASLPIMNSACSQLFHANQEMMNDNNYIMNPSTTSINHHNIMIENSSSFPRRHTEGSISKKTLFKYSQKQKTGSSSTSSNNSNKGEDDDEEGKRKQFLERNRQAALKCRQRKKQWLNNLQNRVEFLSNDNEQLQSQATMLREEVLDLKTLLLAHRDCPVAQANGTTMSMIQCVSSLQSSYDTVPPQEQFQPQQSDDL